MNLLNHIQTLRGEYQDNQSLARYTSWRVGGLAEHVYRPADLHDLQYFLKQLPMKEHITFLGLGSNTLIRDHGIAGTVILTLNRLNEIRCCDATTIYAQAGVTCAKLAKFCSRLGFESSAFFAGIPGTVGGALRMNAGAFNQETWDHVVAVEMLNRKGNCHYRLRGDFKVGYRFVESQYEEYFAGAYFQFKTKSNHPAQKRITQLLRQRQRTQPIGSLNCGSVFRNPPKDYAGRLIEACGLKAYRIGGAEVSIKHANFILNVDKASARDIESLIEHVQRVVLSKQGVCLVRECHILGHQ